MMCEMAEYRRLIGLLVARRQQLKLTQVDVNTRMRLGDNLVNRWENFRRFPKGPMLIRWARALGLRLIVGTSNLDYTPATDKVLEYTIKKIAQEAQKRREGRQTGAQFPDEEIERPFRKMEGQ